MKRLLIGALLASVAMWFWGFLFWGISPLPAQFLRSVPDEVALAEKLKAAIPETGVYLIPNMGAGVSQEEFTKRHLAGPLAHIVYVREGADPMSAAVLGGGWLHMLVCALILGWILLYVPGPTTFGSRYCILALAGTAAAVWSNLGKPIWWHQPWGFHILYAVYDLTSLLLAAVILAWYVRRT
jgi:hypothetical protein